MEVSPALHAVHEVKADFEQVRQDHPAELDSLKHGQKALEGLTSSGSAANAPPPAAITAMPVRCPTAQMPVAQDNSAFQN